MAFRGLHDADPLDPSVLLLQDRHRSGLHFIIHELTFQF